MEETQMDEMMDWESCEAEDVNIGEEFVEGAQYTGPLIQPPPSNIQCGDMEPEQPPYYRGPNLTNYQRRAIKLEIRNLSDCPPQDFVEIQITELQNDLLEIQPDIETDAGSNKRCIYCQVNEATLFFIPCGHRAGCRSCCLMAIEIPIYFDDNAGQTNVRLPIRCHQCRCLVGQIRKMYE